MDIVKINNGPEAHIEIAPDNVQINGRSLSWDLERLPDGSFHILADGKGYNAHVLGVDKAAKQVTLMVNGGRYVLDIQEPMDVLLKKMGINMAQGKKAESIKAPMPGLVLQVMVKEGQAIKKGDPVLVLEAMKMENVFKAPADAIVKAIKIEERQAVEKGEVLIELA